MAKIVFDSKQKSNVLVADVRKHFVFTKFVADVHGEYASDTAGSGLQEDTDD